MSYTCLFSLWNLFKSLTLRRRNSLIQDLKGLRSFKTREKKYYLCKSFFSYLFDGKPVTHVVLYLLQFSQTDLFYKMYYYKWLLFQGTLRVFPIDKNDLLHWFPKIKNPRCITCDVSPWRTFPGLTLEDQR